MFQDVPSHPYVSRLPPDLVGFANATADAEPKEQAFTEVRFIIALHGQYPTRA